MKKFFKINKDVILYDVVRIQLFNDELYIASVLGQKNYSISELYMIDNVKTFGIYYEGDCVLWVSYGSIFASSFTVMITKRDDYWKIRRWFLKLLNEEYEEE